MIFITIDELKTRKFENLINDVAENDNSILEELEAMAIEEITSYIGARYDTRSIFSKKGSDRSHLIKRMVIDFVLCFLWERTNSNEIPMSLQERCEKNTSFLKDIAKGTISPDLPRVDSVLQTNSFMKFGSETRFNNTSYI